MNADFFKYEALGNDMLVIDPARFAPELTPAAARRLCDRHRGLGADGICYGPLPGSQPPAMRFFNPDGTEAEKSGNGLRIFARYVWDAGHVAGRHFEIAIGGETIPVTVEDEAARTLSLGMGRLSFGGEQGENSQLTINNSQFTIFPVSIGNPHCVIFVDDSPAGLARQYGPAIETAPQFPQRTNVQFGRVIDRHTLEIDIWERGAGYTLASGTSASAAAGAAIKTGRCDSPVTVRMAGGAAVVAVNAGWQVTLTGAVAAVASGQLASDLYNSL